MYTSSLMLLLNQTVVHRYHDGKTNDLYMHPIVWCNAYISWYFCHYRYDFHHFLLAYSIESDDSCHFTLYPRYFHIYMKNIISLGYLSSFVESPFFWYLCPLVFIRKTVYLLVIFIVLSEFVLYRITQDFLLSVNHASAFGMAYFWAFVHIVFMKTGQNKLSHNDKWAVAHHQLLHFCLDPSQLLLLISRNKTSGILYSRGLLSY